MSLNYVKEYNYDLLHSYIKTLLPHTAYIHEHECQKEKTAWHYMGSRVSIKDYYSRGTVVSTPETTNLLSTCHLTINLLKAKFYFDLNIFLDPFRWSIESNTLSL